MLRILEISAALIIGAFGVYFGVLGGINIFKYFLNYYAQDADEKVRNAKIRAKYFSLSATGWMVALAIGFSNLVALIFIPFFVGVLWLDYVIYKAVVLRTERRSK